MAISKKMRQQVFEKYGGKCGYTGLALIDKWQIDHIIPRCHWIWFQPGTVNKPDDIDNLMPCLRIINHYKREKDLEQWRDYIGSLHIRLAKLPKEPRVKKSEEHKRYLLEVAEHFGITVDQPFSGKFFFELINSQ